MKYVTFFILFLALQANAIEEKIVVWLVAPEIWLPDTQSLAESTQNLEEYLQQNLGMPTKVELKTTRGFALSQYTHLKEQLSHSKPDFIFYIQSARLFAKDLEEVLLSKNKPDNPLISDKFSAEDVLKDQPTWSNMLVPNFEIFRPIKEAIFIRNRLSRIWHSEDSPTKEEEFYLEVSILPHRNIQFLLQEKSKVLFLLSPERVRYSREIFPDSGFITSIAQMFFSGVNIDREYLKEKLAYSSLNTHFLPKEFAQLSKSENLMAQSQFSLNSVGVLTSFQIIKPVISSYLVTEKSKKKEQELRAKEASQATSRSKKRK